MSCEPVKTKREIVCEETSRLMGLSAAITFAIVLEVVPPTVTSMLVGQASGTNAEVVIAAGSLADFFQGLIPVNVTLGLGAAVATLCAHAYGANRLDEFWLVAQAGFLASAYCAVPIAILSFNGASILQLLGQDPELAQVAETFILIGLAALPFSIVFTIARSTLQAQHIAFPCVAASLVASLISLPLGYAVGNYTSLGYVGVALTTIFSNVIKALAVIPVVLRNESFRTAWPGWQWRRAHERTCSLWRIGIGSVLMTTFQSAGYMTVSILSGYLPHPALQIAASGIGGSFVALSFIPMMGITSAGTVRIGNALGGGEPVRASLAAAVMLAGLVVVALVGLVVTALLARPFAAAFTSDVETVELTTSLAHYLLPLIPLVALAGSAQAVFQACNAQWLCAALNCGFLLVTSVGAGLVCAFPLGGGLRGLWNGQLIGFAGLIVASAVWYRQLNWQHQADEASRHEKQQRLSRVQSTEDPAVSTPGFESITYLSVT